MKSDNGEKKGNNHKRGMWHTKRVEVRAVVNDSIHPSSLFWCDVQERPLHFHPLVMCFVHVSEWYRCGWDLHKWIKWAIGVIIFPSVVLKWYERRRRDELDRMMRVGRDYLVLWQLRCYSKVNDVQLASAFTVYNVCWVDVFVYHSGCMDCPKAFCWQKL